MKSRNITFNQNKLWWSFWPQIDWFLLILVVGLSIFGGIMIYATQIYEQGTDWFQQLIMTGIGLVILM